MKDQHEHPFGISSVAKASLISFIEALHGAVFSCQSRYNFPEDVTLYSKCTVTVSFTAVIGRVQVNQEADIPLFCRGVNPDNGNTYWSPLLVPVEVAIGGQTYLVCFGEPNYNGSLYWFTKLPLEEDSQWTEYEEGEEARNTVPITFRNTGSENVPEHPEVAYFKESGHPEEFFEAALSV